MKPTRRLLLLATTALAVGGCATMPEPTTLTDTAARNPQLTTLTKLLAEGGLADTLRGAGPYTVFAPSDDAFRALPAKTAAELGKDKELLKSVLTFHVVPGRALAADVKNGNVKSLQGSNLALSKAGTFVTVDEALVTQADVNATNGVIHVIDKVLLPPKR
jgi:uncharacterized surface protein with fasciclin (FAS1) repeats